LNSAQKLQEDLPREKKNRIGNRDVGPAPKTPSLPYRVPSLLGRRGLHLMESGCKEEKKIGFKTKGTLSLVS